MSSSVWESCLFYRGRGGVESIGGHSQHGVERGRNDVATCYVYRGKDHVL